MLCFWAKRFIRTVPLSSQVYKWIAVNLMLGVNLRCFSMALKGPYSRHTIETGISSGLMRQLTRMQTLPFTLKYISTNLGGSVKNKGQRELVRRGTREGKACDQSQTFYRTPPNMSHLPWGANCHMRTNDN